QAVEGEEDFACKFVTPKQRRVRREVLANRDGLVNRPCTQVGGSFYCNFSRELVARPETAFGEHFAGPQRAEDRLRVFLNVAPELLPGITGTTAQMKAVAHAFRCNAHEKLRIGALVRLRLAVKRNPLNRLVRRAAPEVVFADARDGTAGLRV